MVKIARGDPIIRTLDRGRKFKEERYISADSIYTATDENYFYVKCNCKASMIKEYKQVKISLDKSTSYDTEWGIVYHATCTCRAGLGSNCNHVMALLLELAEYSQNQLQEVPKEIACTSKLRQWGVPGRGDIKEAVMDCTIQGKYHRKRGILCTLYDPRINNSRTGGEQRLGVYVLVAVYP